MSYEPESVFALNARSEARLLAVQMAAAPVAWSLHQPPQEEVVARARGYLRSIRPKASGGQREAVDGLLEGLSVVTNRAVAPAGDGLSFSEGVTEAMRSLEASKEELPEPVAEHLRTFRQALEDVEEADKLSASNAAAVQDIRRRLDAFQRKLEDAGLMQPKDARNRRTEDVKLGWEPGSLRD